MVVREEEKKSFFDARKDDAFDFGSVESFVDETDIVGATTVGECGGEGDGDGCWGEEGGVLTLPLPPTQATPPFLGLVTVGRWRHVSHRSPPNPGGILGVVSYLMGACLFFDRSEASRPAVCAEEEGEAELRLRGGGGGCAFIDDGFIRRAISSLRTRAEVSSAASSSTDLRFAILW